jgi:high-affinity iron transporter
MLAVAIIVSREVLEAALIVSIVMAASVGVAGRTLWVAAGIGVGVCGAGLVAIFAASIADAFQGAGQEVLNAGVLLLAVCMLGWHNLWMARHARQMADEAKDIGRQVAAGTRPLAALTLIAGVAVLREGSEIVLFVYSVAASSHDGPLVMLAGGLIGLAGGIVVGVILYYGLLRIPVHRLFAVTGWMVLLLAAGLAAQAAGFLVQADLLPPLGDQIWNTSFLLSEESIVGKTLHTLVGYVARPAGIQIIAYVFVLLAIGLPMRAMARGRVRPRKVLIAGAEGFVALIPAYAARAELQVRMPEVEYRELEFEHNGFFSFDKNPTLGGQQSYTNSIGYGVTPWWEVELEGETNSIPDSSVHYTATTMENTFQITQPGQYFFNLGFFAEYSQSALNGEPNSFTLGPLVQKELYDVLGVDSLHTLNVLFDHDVGHNASHATGLQIAWQSRLLLNPYIDPAVEYYGFIDDLGEAGKFSQQQHFIGPVAVGAINFSPYGKLKYEVGYMFGMTEATPRGAIRWKVEYEIAF